MKRGFTLVELILVVALVGLLMGLLMPVVGNVKKQSHVMLHLSNLRQHTAIFETYTTDWHSYFPYYADPKDDIHVVRCTDISVAFREYFAVVVAWNIALSDYYYNGRYEGKDFQSPYDNWPHPLGIWCNYTYSTNFISRPEFWNRKTRTGPRQWQPVRDSEVIYPSQKGILIDNYSYWLGGVFPRRTTVGFVDGSARYLSQQELHAGYYNGEGNWPGSLRDSPTPVLHTYDGVRGRDID